MVEYTLEEGLALLQDNKKAASDMIQQLEEDLGFIRDQVNTTEVSIARVYNYDVKVRKAQGLIKS